MNNSKSSLFLMELIIVILFFSISAAVCVQLFFNAHTTDISTNELSHAEIAMQNISEGYLAFDADLDKLAKEYGSCTFDNSTVSFAYDSNWTPVSPDDANAVYLIYLKDTTTSLTEDSSTGGIMKEAAISVIKSEDNSEILSNTLKKYIPYSN